MLEVDASAATDEPTSVHKVSGRKSGFTDRYLTSLKPKGARYVVFDRTRKGLLLRVACSATKTFCFRFKLGGESQQLTLGTYPAMTLREAYETHAELVSN